MLLGDNIYDNGDPARAHGGAKLRPTGSNADIVVSRSVRPFLSLSAYEDRLVVQAVDQQAAVIDGVVLNR